jgi:DtxR family Mn-dependent transcriptional regulator
MYLTPTSEDYLRALCKLQSSGKPAAVGDVAQHLGVTPASVTGMFRSLAKKKLVSYQPYRGVELTNLGRRLAIRILRRHRLIERYLVDVLHVPWEEAHQEADAWEHVLSPKMEARFDQLLGNPTTDPHGAVIPTVEGKIPSRPCSPMNKMKTGDTGIVAEVSDHDPNLLRYLESVGILPGASVLCLRHEAYEGSLLLQVNSTQRRIGFEATAHVHILLDEERNLDKQPSVKGKEARNP